MLDLEQVNNIHETLEAMRTQLGWTKKQLAANSGFSYKQMRIWLDNGYNCASYARIKKVFQVMHDSLKQQTQD